VIKGGNHAWTTTSGTTTSELAIKGGNHGQHMVYDLRGDNQGMLDHDLRGDNQRRQSCTANDFTNIYADVSFSCFVFWSIEI
jgi:hypothetical protein